MCIMKLNKLWKNSSFQIIIKKKELLTMNRIQKLFEIKKHNVLTTYFTAGYPALEDTMRILKTLEEEGVDMVEIGMPFSDPLSDGPVIQQSGEKALRNEMNMHTLFKQLATLRTAINIPVLLMGYLNPVYKFGIERFCKKCNETEIDGVILPDLPLDEYEKNYREVFEKYGIVNIFLITPQTSEERIRHIDAISNGFIYMVSSASTTGASGNISDEQGAYFNRIAAMKLNTPVQIGFGISNKETFDTACSYANGAIIGSALIKALEYDNDLEANIRNFVRKLKNGSQ